MTRKTRVKPSAIAIGNLKPREERYEIGIEGYRGLWVRVYPTGHRSFIYRSGQDGAMARLTLKATTLAEATSEWSDLRKRKTQGHEDIAATRRRDKTEAQRQRVKERSEPTVQALAERYISEYARRKKRSWLQDQQRLNRYVLPKWGKLKAAEISRADVHALVGALVEDTPTLANRILALVRKLFSFGVDVGVLANHPSLRMKAPGQESPRTRYLNDNELRFLWRATERAVWRKVLPQEVAFALRLQLLTGTRPKEVFGARWKEFDFGKREWSIPAERMKNKLPHLVPLPTLAFGLVESIYQSAHDEFVFPWPGKAGHLRGDTLDRALRNTCQRVKRFGMEPFRPHDLRRTVETGLARLIPREIRDRVLSHKDRSVGGLHYNMHDFLAEKRSALVAWEDELRRVIESDNYSQGPDANSAPSESGS